MPAAELINEFIDDLAHTTVAADATNQYAFDGPAGNAVRRANLQRALELALAAPPLLLIVGEAPGYNGARRTGVPFTSERLLIEGIDPPGLFGAQRGFALAGDDERISAEQTATLVYRELRALNVTAVGWNAFPFHPHRPGQPQSNRPPRAAELAQGRPFLQRMLAFFPQTQVVAMGNYAARALDRLEVPHTRVRHPAQGGARRFAEGMRNLVAQLS
jgi:uracil-DNA glycosylase